MHSDGVAYSHLRSAVLFETNVMKLHAPLHNAMDILVDAVLIRLCIRYE